MPSITECIIPGLWRSFTRTKPGRTATTGSCLSRIDEARFVSLLVICPRSDCCCNLCRIWEMMLTEALCALCCEREQPGDLDEAEEEKEDDDATAEAAGVRSETSTRLEELAIGEGATTTVERVGGAERSAAERGEQADRSADGDKQEDDDIDTPRRAVKSAAGRGEEGERSAMAVTSGCE